MPAPSAAQMKNQAKALYGQQFGAEGEEYMDLLFEKISKAWDTWQKSIKVGSLMVSGGGVGAWAGTGTGGTLTGQPFILEPFSFKNNSAQQLKFTKALGDALKAKFTPWPMSYKISVVNFAGTSGASPTSPGPVNASCAPTPLSTAGSGTSPSGIADVWAKSLTPPEFQLDNPNAKSGDLIKAIGKVIEQSFQSVWLVTTMISGNSVSATGTPGGVVAGFPSNNDGKLL